MHPWLPQVVEQQLVLEHLPTLLERGFGALMDAHRVEDVARLYSLAGRVGALEALRAAFKDYVRGAALRLVKDEEKVNVGKGVGRVWGGVRALRATSRDYVLGAALKLVKGEEKVCWGGEVRSRRRLEVVMVKGLSNFSSHMLVYALPHTCLGQGDGGWPACTQGAPGRGAGKRHHTCQPYALSL